MLSELMLFKISSFYLYLGSAKLHLGIITIEFF